MDGPSGGSRQNIGLLTGAYRNRGGRFGAPKPPAAVRAAPPVSRLERARTSKAPGFAGGYKPACADWPRASLSCNHRKRAGFPRLRSEEHTSELQSLMRISYAVFCLKKKNILKT